MGTRVYHAHYHSFVDRVSSVEFKPAVLNGRTVAAAVVSDPAPFLARGFLLWPGENVAALENLTVKELLALADERGVEVLPKARKADIIALLE